MITVFFALFGEVLVREVECGIGDSGADGGVEGGGGGFDGGGGGGGGGSGGGGVAAGIAAPGGRRRWYATRFCFLIRQ